MSGVGVNLIGDPACGAAAATHATTELHAARSARANAVFWLKSRLLMGRRMASRQCPANCSAAIERPRRRRPRVVAAVFGPNDCGLDPSEYLPFGAFPVGGQTFVPTDATLRVASVE